MLPRWWATVRGLISSRRAIAVLVRPARLVPGAEVRGRSGRRVGCRPVRPAPAGPGAGTWPGTDRVVRGRAVPGHQVAWLLLEQPGHAAVGERLAPGLAGRAVLERGVGERHLAHRVAADRARLAGPAVHPQPGLLLRLEVGGGQAPAPRHRLAQGLGHRRVQGRY